MPRYGNYQIQIEIEISEKENALQRRFDVERLNDPKVASPFQADSFAVLSLLEDDINALTNNVRYNLIEMTVSVFERERKKNLMSEMPFFINMIRGEN